MGRSGCLPVRGQTATVCWAYFGLNVPFALGRPVISMSRNAQTQTTTDERYTGHAATNGEFSRYLEAENPNVPTDRISERFHKARNAAGPNRDIKQTTNQLNRIRTNHSCPDCGSSDVFYTRTVNIARCDGCGLYIGEGVDPNDVLEGGI